MEFIITKGTADQAELFISLTRTVQAAMAQPEWFYLDSPEEVRAMLDQGMMELWMAWEGKNLAAVFSVITPGLGESNYGYDLGFSQEALLRVANMDTAAVHPDYRGHGLQKRLMAQAEQDLAEQGSRILLCTIHPDNCYSLQNALERGYTIQKTLPKYGSRRCILRKDIPEKKKIENSEKRD